MTDWQVVFLGIMAVALVTMAVMQFVMARALLRASREVSGAVGEIQRDLGSLIDKASRMTDDAARAAALTLAQVERIDRLVTSIATRVEATVGIVQDAIVQPMRQGATVVAAFRAVAAVIREWQERKPAVRDDEDPLFVG